MSGQGEVFKRAAKPAVARDARERLREEHWRGALRHRADGPAVIERCPRSGIVVREEYWLDGTRHRKDGPAVIERDSRTGQISRVEFFTAGKFRACHVIPLMPRIQGGRAHPIRPEWL
jgi:hypothetical protein